MVFLGLCICSLLLKWNEVRYMKKNLPPGTMGWPLFGETTEFLKHGPNFMKSQRARYGNLYKTHILGCPTVICMDPDLNRYILMNEGKGLVPGYPQSMLDILGKYNIAAVHGSLHKTMRGAMLALIGPTMVRDHLMPKIDKFIRSHLNHLDGKIIDIQDKTKEARKKITSMLTKIINERRATSNTFGDMLDALLKTDEIARAKLTDEQIVDLILTIIYSGYETVSTTSMMAIKYLHDNPKALQGLRDEHFEIRKWKSPEDPINWNEYKSMNFTRAVIYETLRMATVINGLLRKTSQDMDMKGYVIPEGWKIYVYMRESNYDPFLYPEPFSFNPWRWLDKSLESHQCFLLFGGGSRLCPGKDLGTVEISIFIHYFVTRYRWEEVGKDKLVKFPRVEAPNGIRMRVLNY
ncbi:Cytochrome P450 85A1 [Acorus calamus]|uniref:Cytochrome P450 85A1 n=1 Tax=Acorus calamus TaxID=4465 RepID=A0AAV9CRE2_ACOCL|nr:Cytochrome P450 85A1 [Acorus calamus]